MLTIKQLNDSARDVDLSKHKRTVGHVGPLEAVAEQWVYNIRLYGTSLDKTEGLTLAEAFEAHAAGWVVVDGSGEPLDFYAVLEADSTWHVTRHKDGKPVEVAGDVPDEEPTTFSSLIEAALAPLEATFAALAEDVAALKDSAAEAAEIERRNLVSDDAHGFIAITDTERQAAKEILAKLETE